MANVIPGTSTNDLLLGSTDDDIILGYDGADQLFGDAGNDLINGGSGNDLMVGGLGDDTYVVADLNDNVREFDSEGIDTVWTSINSYVLTPNVENLVMFPELTAPTSATGNDLNNAMTGNNNNNTLRGLNGNDTLVGLGGDDVLKGGRGNDTLLGGRDVLGDTLDGGGGRDRLVGGAGLDFMTGGANADVFDFNEVEETGATIATRDRITDFVHLTDNIDLSTIDANGGAAGNTAFSFLAPEGAAFTGARGELRWFQLDLAGTDDDRTIIAGDINGDASADFQIELTGLKTLTEADFFL